VTSVGGRSGLPTPCELGVSSSSSPSCRDAEARAVHPGSLAGRGFVLDRKRRGLSCDRGSSSTGSPTSAGVDPRRRVREPGAVIRAGSKAGSPPRTATARSKHGEPRGADLRRGDAHAEGEAETDNPASRSSRDVRGRPVRHRAAASLAVPPTRSWTRACARPCSWTGNGTSSLARRDGWRVSTRWRSAGADGRRAHRDLGHVPDRLRSRMKAAARASSGPSQGPMCGMDVDEKRAAAAGRTSEYEGRPTILRRRVQETVRRGTGEVRQAVIVADRDDRTGHRLLGPQQVPRPPADRGGGGGGRGRSSGFPSTPSRLSDTQVILYTRWTGARRRRSAGDYRSSRDAGRAERARGARFSDFATRSSTSSSRTAPTSTGRGRGRSSTSPASSAGSPGRQDGARPDDGLGGLPYALVDESASAACRPALVPGLTLRYYLKRCGVAESRRSAATAGSTR